jgi:type I restriction enzyme S subunit
VGNLNEIVELHKDSINPTNFPNEIFEHYSIPAFDEGQMPTQDLGSTIKSNKFLLPYKCILISKLNPRISRIWFPSINKNHRSVASTEFLVLLPKVSYSCEFIYSLCVSSLFQDTFISLVTGTSSSHQRVKSDDLLSIKIVCPSEAALKVFSEKVEPMFKHIKSNKEQSCTLAAIHDALLPKLLSGEIRANDAEGFVERNI